ncbi:uncharacterized protein TRIVIDRAFT_201147 [Trichoderma virens Gv29-8]|uniref:Uncharacterized protein n=1 Tax=Hypocrea virens (strain Gv29-8 / FGSC 10586) TaxID=413071 RepID=G9MS09_HYPVG|nr:uncharacterized protein TRIVIDRAFT_201147 [Trichoderma virens Gv29-8]EHK22877.1 hypothetical protein TRIVIDRAFT_201147 [Trichoderma virens Gv29-8]
MCKLVISTFNNPLSLEEFPSSHHRGSSGKRQNPTNTNDLSLCAFLCTVKSYAPLPPKGETVARMKTRVKPCANNPPSTDSQLHLRVFYKQTKPIGSSFQEDFLTFTPSTRTLVHGKVLHMVSTTGQIDSLRRLPQFVVAERLLMRSTCNPELVQAQAGAARDNNATLLLTSSPSLCLLKGGTRQTQRELDHSARREIGARRVGRRGEKHLYISHHMHGWHEGGL